MTPMQFLCQVCERAVAYGVMDISKVRGWSDEEIAAVESAIALRLPTYYRQFLRVLGKDGGGLMVGTHIFPRSPDDFPKWRAFATRLMGPGGEPLPDNAVVFGDHQGYQFWYFIADPADDDPPVFYYHEGDNKPRQIDTSFTAFILSTVEHERLAKQWLDVHTARAQAARAAFLAEHGGAPDARPDSRTPSNSPPPPTGPL